MARPSKSKMEEKCGVLFKTVKSERYIKGFWLQKQKKEREREKWNKATSLFIYLRKRGCCYSYSH